MGQRPRPLSLSFDIGKTMCSLRPLTPSIKRCDPDWTISLRKIGSATLNSGREKIKCLESSSFLGNL